MKTTQKTAPSKKQENLKKEADALRANLKKRKRQEDLRKNKKKQEQQNS